MNHYAISGGALLLAALFFACAPAPASAAPLTGAPASAAQAKHGDETFLESDDYSDDDEVVGKFLTDADYAKMYEDFELQGAEFDWGWMAPGFDIGKYKTVAISVTNKSDALDPDIEKDITTVFTAAMGRLGLKVVPSGADLDLGMALVDYNADSTYAFVTMIKPFVEIELRLKDAHSGADLLLIRNQEHSSSPKQAATEYARDMIKALRTD